MLPGYTDNSPDGTLTRWIRQLLLRTDDSNKLHRTVPNRHVALPGNQTVNGENKHQPVASGETGLLDSNLSFFSIFAALL